MATPADNPKRTGFNIQVLAYRVLEAGIEAQRDKLSSAEYDTLVAVMGSVAPPPSPDRAAVEKSSRETRESFVRQIKDGTIEVFDTEFGMSFAAATMHVLNAMGQIAALAEVAMLAKKRDEEKRRIILPGEF